MTSGRYPGTGFISRPESETPDEPHSHFELKKTCSVISGATTRNLETLLDNDFIKRNNIHTGGRNDRGSMLSHLLTGRRHGERGPALQID